jgi:uncharacterized protein (DUF2249 family)
MKHSQALISLSREHNTALALARRAVAASRGVSSTRKFAAILKDLFERELEPQFRVEEQLLLPPLRDSGEHVRAARIHEEHRQLRVLAQAAGRGYPARVESFGLLLEAHIHFEERSLSLLADAMHPAATASVATRAAVDLTPHHSSTTGTHAMATAPHLHLSPDAIYRFGARGIDKRFRHAAIFGALDALNRGETMRFVNDHDPLPLLEQLRARYRDAIRIDYVQREPGAITIDFVRI